MEPVRLGVIGCGVIGRVHIRQAQQLDGARVAAVADLRAEAARGAAAEFGVGKVYASAEALLDDAEVEAVVLAMPTACRTELALKAFARGKHVLTEKPVAMNAAEVERLIAARGALTAACCSSRQRFLAPARVAADFIAGGGLGRLRALHCRALQMASGPPRSAPPAWRLQKAQNGGGILVNWGCYDLDYLLGLAGWTLRPRTVLARTWTPVPAFRGYPAPGSDAETHYAALILCDGGVAITCERAEYAAAAGEGAWQIMGEKGTLQLSMPASKEMKIVFHAADAEKGVVARTLWEGDQTWEPAHAGPVRDFTQAIRGGTRPSTGLEEALVLQRVTDAIYASAAQGRAVEIP